MLFGTPEFLTLFLPVVLLVHYLAGTRLRNTVLLGASLFFYAYGEGAMVLVMVGSILANWAFGLGVAAALRPRGSQRAENQRTARLWVALSVIFNLGLLAAFKYGRWLFGDAALVQVGEELSRSDGPPIGISFFTFQALSYVIDVYRGEVEHQKSPLRFGLYIALFPQLIAGPIVRYKDIALQLLDRRVSVAWFSIGVRRFSLGLGKKVLLADTLGRIVDPIFALEPGALTPHAAWIGLVAYTLQIYFDFSGYSDMAIGLGRMLGFRFLENFDHPYVARSITEFWRRWHISLSTWFRDYLYIPLGGNRLGRGRTYLNLVIVFFLCGLWHGASWGFIAWGLYHGLFLVCERAGAGAALARWPRGAQHVYVLLAVMGGWVLFRAPDFAHALGYVQALGGGGAAGVWPAARFFDPAGAWALALGIVGVTPWLPELGSRLRRAERAFVRQGAEIAAFAGVILVLLLSCLVLTGISNTPFIYLRF